MPIQRPIREAIIQLLRPVRYTVEKDSKLYAHVANALLIEPRLLPPTASASDVILREFAHRSCVAPTRPTMRRRPFEVRVRVGAQRRDHQRLAHAGFDKEPLLPSTS